ncbi:hypothetical protein V8F20_010536 [Naviculisporaceae sp. PSN 640]
MADAEVQCSLCQSTCTGVCYQRHKDWYACHAHDCALHYPENVVINDEGRFVLGSGGSRDSEGGRGRGRGRHQSRRPRSRARRSDRDRDQSQSRGPPTLRPRRSSRATSRHGTRGTSPGGRAASPGQSVTIPESLNNQHRERRRHRQTDVSTNPATASARQSPTIRSRLVDFLRNLLCGLIVELVTPQDDDSHVSPSQNQRPLSPIRKLSTSRRYTSPARNTAPSSRRDMPPPRGRASSSSPQNAPTSRNNRASSRDNTPASRSNKASSRHYPPSSSRNLPAPPRNRNRSSSRNSRASRSPRTRHPARQNNDSGDTIFDLPPLTRQESGRRRAYRDPPCSTRYTVVWERPADDSPINTRSWSLRSVRRDRDILPLRDLD